MLTRVHDGRFEFSRSAPQLVNHEGELDGLRSRAQNCDNSARLWQLRSLQGRGCGRATVELITAACRGKTTRPGLASALVRFVDHLLSSPILKNIFLPMMISVTREVIASSIFDTIDRVITNRKGRDFGTRWSEVEILSSRTFFSMTCTFLLGLVYTGLDKNANISSCSSFDTVEVCGSSPHDLLPMSWVAHQ
jgi:hypothetical protein